MPSWSCAATPDSRATGRSPTAPIADMGAGLLHAGGGDLHVVVAGERLLDQALAGSGSWNTSHHGRSASEAASRGVAWPRNDRRLGHRRALVVRARSRSRRAAAVTSQCAIAAAARSSSERPLRARGRPAPAVAAGAAPAWRRMRLGPKRWLT